MASKDYRDRADTLDFLIRAAQEAEREGQHAEARALYEWALQALRGPAEGPTASDLARWIGRSYYADGDLDAASDSAQLALAIGEAHGSDERVASALNLLGILHQTRGELDEAVSLYRRAEAHVERAGDARLAAMIGMNLATIANIRGDFDEALLQYERSLRGYRETNNDEHVAYVLNNMGMLFTDLGRWDEAESVFGEALDRCDRGGSPGIRTTVRINFAELQVAVGRVDAAERLCEAAWELMADVADVRNESELCNVHGMVLRERGDFASADELFRRAEKLAIERGDLLLVAEALREQAILFSLQDRNQETLRCLNRSHQLFSQLRARSDIADLDGKMASLEQTFLSIVSRWGESIEAADFYTQGHCVRVADYACALARAAGMGESTLLWFRMGALLHDVGKITVPPRVLNKTGGYTPEERLLMERHTVAGVELLEDIRFPWDVRPMILSHHERWAGGGYPAGLAGEEIPLAARILSIADVFDALTSDRPYRRAYSRKQALRIMGGTLRGHFDPSLLALWMELCERGDLPLPSASAGSIGFDGRAGARTLPAVLLVGERHSAAELDSLARGWSSAVRTVAAPVWDASLSARAEAEGLSAVVVAVRGRPAACVSSVLRVREALPELPVIALLDQEDEGLALRLLQYGAQDCLVRDTADAYLVARAARRAVARGQLQDVPETRALRDDLTGLYNRRGFFTASERRLRALRDEAEPPVILYLDLASLKGINERFGHAEGDRALLEVARVLRGVFRESDVIGRTGGDEFAVLVTREDAGRVRYLARRIEAALEARNETGDRPFPLEVTIAHAVIELAGDDTVARALSRADHEMYLRRYGGAEVGRRA